MKLQFSIFWFIYTARWKYRKKRFSLMQRFRYLAKKIPKFLLFFCWLWTPSLCLPVNIVRIQTSCRTNTKVKHQRKLDKNHHERNILCVRWMVIGPFFVIVFYITCIVKISSNIENFCIFVIYINIFIFNRQLSNERTYNIISTTNMDVNNDKDATHANPYISIII